MTRVAFRDRGEWFVSAAAMLWFGPFLVLTTLESDTLAIDRSAGAWLQIGTIVAMTAIAVKASRLIPALLRREFRFSVVPIGAALVGVFALRARPRDVADWLHSPGDVVFVVSLIVGFALLAAMASGLGQRIDADERARRVVPAAVTLWLVGIQLGRVQSFSWACFGEPTSAEFAARFSAGGYTARVFCGVTASICICGAVVIAVRRASFRRVLPLFGVALWLVSRAFLDLASKWVASGVFDADLGADAISGIGLAADVVGGAGLVLALGCWIAGRASQLAPVVPVVVLASLPLFEPSPYGTFPQQAPHDFWTELDVTPVQGPREGRIPGVAAREGEALAALDHDDELHFYYFATARTVTDSESVEHRGISLVVDRDATLGGLRRAASTLRRFEYILVVWRINDLASTSAGSRARWTFLELSSRALRGRKIHIGAGGPAETARQVRGADDLRVSEWIRASPSGYVEYQVSIESSTPHDPIDVTGRPPQQISRPIVARELVFGFWVMLFGLGVGLVVVVRELRLARQPARARGRRLVPFWVDEKDAERCVLIDRSPYRDQSVVQIARTRTSLVRLGRHALKCARFAAKWMFMATVATGLGLLVALVLSIR